VFSSDRASEGRQQLDRSFVVSVDKSGSAVSTEHAEFETAENAWQQESLRMREGAIVGAGLYRLDTDGSVCPIKACFSALQKEADLFIEVCSEIRKSIH
jgi:hypothetical protein